MSGTRAVDIPRLCDIPSKQSSCSFAQGNKKVFLPANNCEEFGRIFIKCFRFHHVALALSHFILLIRERSQRAVGGVVLEVVESFL